ncbi:CbiX/SirB N-terminal domain-containing protein [bacterium]|nr:CbiX/SirB N-terminal domain-containing protein [bacterium]
MKALLLIAHGSPRTQANDDFIKLALSVQKLTPQFCVEACFLDSAVPSIPTALKKLIDQKITEIKVLPYFLVEGKHITTDIPQILEREKENYPHLKIDLLKHFGSMETIPQLIASLIHS